MPTITNALCTSTNQNVPLGNGLSTTGDPIAAIDD
jgi:hypothetical protein